MNSTFLCDVTTCTGLDWDRVKPVIKIWRQRSKEWNWETLLGLTVPLGSVLTLETSWGQCEPVPFQMSEMSIALRQCPTVIWFLLEESESCTQNFLLSGHCFDPWNLISGTYLQVAFMGYLIETECLTVLKMLGSLKNRNICLSAYLILLKLIRRILEFKIRRIKRFASRAVYCALYIAV